MTYLILGRILIFFLCLKRTVCLASSSSTSSSSHPLRIVSLNKNGGNVKYFDLGSTDTTEENNADYPLGDINDKKTAYLSTVIRSTFLPNGFPVKTPPGYLRYSLWSWIQDISTQLRSVLATQRILEGVGVGSSEATALSALFNYLVRDGCGMAAGLLFTYAASSRFRTDVKRWRIFADVSVDIGITLECAATLLPKPFFLPCICLGNMFKACCGVAAGACGGSINLHWAKGSDISDINAKSGAQHTVTGAIGLIFAGIFAKSVNNVSSRCLWMLYSALTYIHLYGNLKCMRLISFDYLNTIRMDMILRQYNIRENSATATTTIPTPQEIAMREPLWFQIPFFGRTLKRSESSEKSSSIHFGVSYNEFSIRSGKPIDMLQSDLIRTTKLQSNKKIQTQHTASAADAYLISSGVHGAEVVVSFLTDSSPEQQTKAYFHAWILGRELQERLDKTSNDTTMDLASRLEVEAESKIILESSWGKFRQSCIDAGWHLIQSELKTGGYEVKVE